MFWGRKTTFCESRECKKTYFHPFFGLHLEKWRAVRRALSPGVRVWRTVLSNWSSRNGCKFERKIWSPKLEKKSFRIIRRPLVAVRSISCGGPFRVLLSPWGRTRSSSCYPPTTSPLPFSHVCVCGQWAPNFEVPEKRCKCQPKILARKLNVFI